MDLHDASDGRPLPPRMRRLTPDEAWDVDHVPVETAPAEWLRPPTELTAEELAALWPDADALAHEDRRRRAVRLWIRDGGICQVCGLTVDIGLRVAAARDGGAMRHPGMASGDHIWPGGSDQWHNLQLTHYWCNLMHNDFPATLIAVQTYRDRLAAALAAAEAGLAPALRGLYDSFWQGRRWRPVTDKNWREEVAEGRPAGEWGKEWTVPPPERPYRQARDIAYPEGLYAALLRDVSDRDRASFIQHARAEGFDREQVEQYLASRRREAAANDR